MDSLLREKLATGEKNQIPLPKKPPRETLNLRIRKSHGHDIWRPPKRPATDHRAAQAINQSLPCRSPGLELAMAS
jgi:hypothetical protein